MAWESFSATATAVVTAVAFLGVGVGLGGSGDRVGSGNRGRVGTFSILSQFIGYAKSDEIDQGFDASYFHDD